MFWFSKFFYFSGNNINRSEICVKYHVYLTEIYFPGISMQLITIVELAPRARTPSICFQNYFVNGFLLSLKKKNLSQFFLKTVCSEEMLQQSSEACIFLWNTSYTGFNSIKWKRYEIIKNLTTFSYQSVEF